MSSEFNNNNVSSEDMGLLYGFGLFETFLVSSNGCVFLMDKHIDRIFASMKNIGFAITMSKNDFKQLIYNYIKNKSIFGKILRVTVTYGHPDKKIKPSVIITSRQNPYDFKTYNNGINLTVSNCKKDSNSFLIRHKTCNYLENLLEAKQAKNAGFDDSIFLNTDNEITETTKSNIFFVRKGKLYTPDTDCGLLPGIIRKWVIKKSKELKVTLNQGHYPLDYLFDSDEVFLTNSVMGIMPVKYINNELILQTRNDYRLTYVFTREYYKSFKT